MTYQEEIENVKTRIENLNVDECVKEALFDELRKAEFFASKLPSSDPDEQERLESNASRHIGITNVIMMGIKRHQIMGDSNNE